MMAAPRGPWRLRGIQGVVSVALAVVLAAGSALPAARASTPPAAQTPAQPSAQPASPPPRWAFEASDVPLDPAFHFCRLTNGLRYIIVPNATPKGMALVRMQVAAGSLDEREDERGYAHFVEHMAFQGSTHVPSGEMVRQLERLGLAFGADTNAATGFDTTTYKFDLPRADPGLLDTSLMLMREIAGELRFPADAVERERGVVLSEKRDRDTPQQRAGDDALAFTLPDALYAHRLPIGTSEALAAASSQRLRAFWAREYVPAKTTLIVVGDIDPAAVETAIRAHFADWATNPSAPQPNPGPIHPEDAGRTHIWLDPTLSDRITALRLGPWQAEPDTIAQRREDVLRQIGYGIVNRRLQHLARQAEPPFRDAGFGTGDIFHTGRATSLVIDDADGQWRKALLAAALEYRRTLAQGFTPAEVAEQLAILHDEAEHAAASADTRPDSTLMAGALALLHDDTVPGRPQDDLARLNQMAPQITPGAVIAAMRYEALTLDGPLDAPLIRYQGRTPIMGGEQALRDAWNEAMRAPLPSEATTATTAFAYTSFGAPGHVVADHREPALGIREIRFANGVRLNLKHTDLAADQVLVELNLDGGDMLATRANPLAVQMVPWLTAGGLGKHSQDELQSLLAGHTVTANLGDTPDSFVSSAQTTPVDLALQLRVMTALLTDPGWRPEGEAQFRLGVDNFFAQARSTPGRALANSIGGILSDGDPRFTLQPPEAWHALDYAHLRQAIGDRLAHGAIELGIVGDIDEAKAIALVGATLGALPPREADFGTYADQRQRPFTQDHTPRVVTHLGPADQAVIQLTWLTRDDSDPVTKQVLNLLERVTQIELTEKLRQTLGKAYSPGAASDLSRAWHGYGTFTVRASVDGRDLPATRVAIAATIAALRDAPVSDDILLRARQPLVESFDNAFKTNGGWMGVVAHAQSQPDRIERQLRARERLLAVTAGDIQAAARRYLAPDKAVEVSVLPQALKTAPQSAITMAPSSPILSQARDKTSP